MGLTVALVLAEILNVVQVFTPAHAVTVCYCCYCCSAASKQKTAKIPGKTQKYLGFPGYFRVLPALDAGGRRGSLPGLPYCCSAGLTLATVVGEPHCCSVVTVNTSNTVQLLTFDNPKCRGASVVQINKNGHLSTVRWVKRNRSPPLRCLCRVLCGCGRRLAGVVLPMGELSLAVFHIWSLGSLLAACCS